MGGCEVRCSRVSGVVSNLGWRAPGREFRNLRPKPGRSLVADRRPPRNPAVAPAWSRSARSSSKRASLAHPWICIVANRPLFVSRYGTLLETGTRLMYIAPPLDPLSHGNRSPAPARDECAQEGVPCCLLRLVLDGSVEVSELVVAELGQDLAQEGDRGVRSREVVQDEVLELTGGVTEEKKWKYMEW